MRVFYRSRQAWNREPVYEQTGPVKFCCAEMCRHWCVLVGFGVPESPRSTCRDVTLCIPRPQANGAAVLEVVAISHCPWCGEAVEVCRRK